MSGKPNKFGFPEREQARAFAQGCDEVSGKLSRTLKASTLSNRGYERSEHLRTVVSNKCTALRRSARTPSSATPSGSFHWIGSRIRGCSLRSYPRLLRVDAFSVLPPLGFIHPTTELFLYVEPIISKKAFADEPNFNYLCHMNYLNRQQSALLANAFSRSCPLQREVQPI